MNAELSNCIGHFYFVKGLREKDEYIPDARSLDDYPELMQLEGSDGAQGIALLSKKKDVKTKRPVLLHILAIDPKDKTTGTHRPVYGEDIKKISVKEFLREYTEGDMRGTFTPVYIRVK